jgi:membrane fusion protein (multidrug efflux system)
MRKTLGIALLVLVSLLFVVYAVRWVKHRMEYAVSDAVFVKADQMATLSFQVSGKVVKIYKDLGDFVKAGEVLAEIEPEDYKLQVEALEEKIRSLRAKREETLLSQKREIEAQLDLLKRDRERFKELLDKGLIPQRRYEEIDTNYRVMLERKKALEKSIDEVQTAKRRAMVGVNTAKTSLGRVQELQKQLEVLDGELSALERQRELAQRNLEYTKLTAPFDGVVAKRFISVGDLVRPGQPAFSVIDLDSLYVEVLLEETKLKGVQKGSKAYVRLDAYPGLVLEGEVEEISPASAATFALAPRDVSAGEFTKVVQRIPVKIRLKDEDKKLLRVGMGGRVEIKRQ